MVAPPQLCNVEGGTLKVEFLVAIVALIDCIETFQIDSLET